MPAVALEAEGACSRSARAGVQSVQTIGPQMQKAQASGVGEARARLSMKLTPNEANMVMAAERLLQPASRTP